MKLIDEKTLKIIKNKRICILSGTGNVTRKTNDDMLAENDTFETSKKLHDYLSKEGYSNLKYFFATDDNLDLLEDIQADIFLNLAEGSREEFLNKICSRLSRMNIPFTGSQEQTNTITTNKYASKKFMELNQIKTPPAEIVNPHEINKISKLTTSYPVIIKPVFEDGSTGITQKSVVEDQKHLIKQCQTMFNKYNQPVIIEKYISGREFAATLIKTSEEIQVLPIAETVFDFKKTKSRKWDIYSYSAKWHHHSEEYLKTPVICPPLNFSKNNILTVETQAKKVFNKFNILDYGRIDFRFDEKTGESYVIDINTNPSLEINENYSLYSSVLASKNDISHFVGAIISSAFERFGEKI